jgi:two-component system, cell cycle response regulator DivK
MRPMSRILYIEDDANNRVLVSRVFKVMAPDFEYVEADSATRGIELALETVPDLILMDISMPDMDGLTATAKLRDLAAVRHVPIVALTANAMEGDKERFIAAGCDGYISKPIDIDTFVETVRSFIKKPDQTPESAESSAKPQAQEPETVLESSKDRGGA